MVSKIPIYKTECKKVGFSKVSTNSKRMIFSFWTMKMWNVSADHRYRKTKIDCLRFVMCPLLAPGFQGFFSFFDVAVNSTNEANKAGCARH